MTLFRHPRVDERVVVIGRTGSGKTQQSAWLLSESPFDQIPYVMIDYKGDALLNAIPYVNEISLDHFPTKPGLYHIKPKPIVDDEKVEKFLWKAWSRGKTGVYVDEAYRVPTKSGAYDALLTQGRSKKCPVISCTQRPAWLSRFVFSEASFFSVFHLTDDDDTAKVARFIKDGRKYLKNSLPEYWSYYYDVSRDILMTMQPVPEAEQILERFAERLKPKRRIL